MIMPTEPIVSIARPARLAAVVRGTAFAKSGARGEGSAPVRAILKERA